MSSVRSVLASLCVAGLTFGAVLLVRGSRSAEAPALVNSPEVPADDAEEWTWHFRKTPRQVADLVGSTERVVSIEVERASPLLLNVATVHNRGRLERASWWLPGPDDEPTTGDSLAAYAGRHESRVVSLAPYVVGGETHFAAVLLANQTEGVGWWWYYDQTPGGVDAALARNEARPIDLRSYVKNGSRVYAVAMVPKRGGDKCWWYMGISAQDVRAHLKENGAVLASLHTADPAEGTFDVVMSGNGVTNMPDVQNVSWVWGTTEID